VLRKTGWNLGGGAIMIRSELRLRASFWSTGKSKAKIGQNSVDNHRHQQHYSQAAMPDKVDLKPPFSSTDLKKDQ